jgi:hypothetical protein
LPSDIEVFSAVNRQGFHAESGTDPNGDPYPGCLERYSPFLKKGTGTSTQTYPGDCYNFLN